MDLGGWGKQAGPLPTNWHPMWGSNPRPSDQESHALPTELAGWPDEQRGSHPCYIHLETQILLFVLPFIISYICLMICIGMVYFSIFEGLVYAYFWI